MEEKRSSSIAKRKEKSGGKKRVHHQHPQTSSLKSLKEIAVVIRKGKNEGVSENRQPCWNKL